MMIKKYFMDLDIFNYFLNQIFVLKAISYIYFCKKIEFFILIV